MNNPLVYKIIGIAITILLSVIGFFLVRYIKNQDETNKELISSVKELTGAMTGLSGSVLRLDERHEDLRNEYKEHIEDYHKNKSA